MVFSCSFAFDAFDSVRLGIYVAWIEKKDPLYLLMVSREDKVIRQELEQEVEHYYTWNIIILCFVGVLVFIKKGMLKNDYLSKLISDSGFGTFLRYLEYKAD